MKVTEPQKIHYLLSEIDHEFQNSTPTNFPLKDFHELCLSHETLRQLLKEMLGQLMAPTDSKELLARVKEVVF